MTYIQAECPIFPDSAPSFRVRMTPKSMKLYRSKLLISAHGNNASLAPQSHVNASFWNSSVITIRAWEIPPPINPNLQSNHLNRTSALTSSLDCFQRRRCLDNLSSPSYTEEGFNVSQVLLTCRVVRRTNRQTSLFSYPKESTYWSSFMHGNMEAVGVSGSFLSSPYSIRFMPLVKLLVPKSLQWVAKSIAPGLSWFQLPIRSVAVILASIQFVGNQMFQSYLGF